MRSPEALQQEYNQQNHPELQPGEMWITYLTQGDAVGKLGTEVKD